MNGALTRRWTEITMETNLHAALRVVVTYLFLLSMSSAFDIFDKKTNLISLIRASASLDPDVECVGYGNGTVFAHFPGQSLKKIFYFEGYNIARKVRTSAGFNSMSREIFVYRDLVTAEIISVWMNPFNSIANEVFVVANDPIDTAQNFDDTRQTILIPPEMVSINMDIFLQVPNILDPKNYSKYSAGPIYEGVELFEYYANLTELASSSSPSVKMAGSWYRKGQFLPWMELGQTPGNLYYHQTFWKLENGLDDVAPDLLDFVKKYYPKYLKAPTTYTGKMVSTWDNFKKTIDQRRALGEPDIIIPLVNIQTNVTTKHDGIDFKIVNAAFKSGEMKVYFNGSVYSEITGRQAIHLFNFAGHARLTLLTFSEETLTVQAEIMGLYHDPVTGKVLEYFDNPIKGVKQKVRPFYLSVTEDVPISSAFSYPLRGLDRVTILFDRYYSEKKSDTGVEEWAINMVNVFVHDEEFVKKSPYFYGTWGRFTSWLSWFEMDDYQGEMVWRINYYKVDTIPKYNVTWN